MVSESIDTTPHWGDLSGRILDGGYELQELLEAEHDRAKFKVRVLGDRTLTPVALVVRAGAHAAQEQIEIWEAARHLRHRNLSTPLASGKTELDGELIYVVLREPDESLSSALAERALNTKEAGAVLESVSHALETLLSDGMVHGCVSPEQIVAIGDSIQLSTEGVRKAGADPAVEITKTKYLAPESGSANVTPAADVWCLGATVFEILKQKECTAKCREEAASLPSPFNRVVERCLTPEPGLRCDLSELIALYRVPASSQSEGRAMAAAAAAGNLRPLPELARIPQIGRGPESERRSEPATAAPPGSVLTVPPIAARRRERAEREGVSSRPPMIWIYAALAVVVLLGVIWAAWPARTSKASARSTTPAPQVRAATPAAGSAWETRTLPAEGSSPASPAGRNPAHAMARHEAAVAPTTSTNANGAVWRVVLYTYNHEDNATRKAQALNQKRPELHATVFSPSGSGSPYLITAGGPMSREAAARLRQRAIAYGMPHDTYIQNFKQ